MVGLVGLLAAASVVEAQATATATVTIIFPDRRTPDSLAGDQPEQHPELFPGPSGNPGMERTTTLIRNGASFTVLHTEVPTL